MNKTSYLLYAAMVISAFIVTEPVSAAPATGLSDSLQDQRNLLGKIARIEQTISEEVRQSGEYSMTLYAPLKELGQALQQSGQHKSAIDSFRRTQHLVHRAFGVYSERQIESLDFMLSSYAALGDGLSLDQQQHFRFSVADRAFQPEDVEHIAAKLKLADWYRQSGRFDRALDLYESTLALIDPEQYPVRVRILRSLAMTQYLAGRCCAYELLDEAVDLIEAAEGGAGFETTQAITDLMDIRSLQRTGGPEIGTRMPDIDPGYLGFAGRKDILRLMSPHKAGRLGSETYVDFGERSPDAPPVPTIGHPVAMCGTTYKRLVSHTARPFALDVTVTVSNEGFAGDIEIIGDVPNRLKRHLRDSLKIARYRAATNEAGEYVDTTLQFTQHFEASELALTSNSAVEDWSRMLVAQTCQVQGFQRI